MFNLDEIQLTHELIGDFTSIITSLALVIGGTSGLRRYRHDLKIKSSDLLIKMEDEFREIAHTCLLIEITHSYNSAIKPILTKVLNEQELNGYEFERLQEIDRCLRFFYLCTVLHADLRIEQAVIARSYYFHANLLLDDKTRPDLATYVRRDYKRLTEWLTKNKPSFDHYRDTGTWPNSTIATILRYRATLFKLKH